MDMHQILTDLKEHIYSEIDNGSKVCNSIKDIHIDTLNAAKAQILACSTLSSDCIVLLVVHCKNN